MVPEILAGVWLSYAASSLVLLFFPGLLHKKKQENFVCQHISHRGGAGERPENTLAAFEHAVGDCDTDMLELDCQLTGDGHVVVAHDPDLRLAGLPNTAISQLQVADLPPLLPRLPIDFSPGESFDASCWPDRRIPLLSDVFRRFPETPINIDVKIDDDRLIAAVAQLVAHFRRQPITVWGNMRASIAAKLHAKDPSVSLFCSMRTVIVIVFSAYVGLLPFLPLREAFFEVPLPSVMYPFAKSRLARFGVWVVDKLVIRPFILHHLRRRGIQVYLWVLNSEADFRRAFGAGATGVMTDYPSNLRAFLHENQQYAAGMRTDKPASSSL